MPLFVSEGCSISIQVRHSVSLFGTLLSRDLFCCSLMAFVSQLRLTESSECPCYEQFRDEATDICQRLRIAAIVVLELEL